MDALEVLADVAAAKALENIAAATATVAEEAGAAEPALEQLAAVAEEAAEMAAEKPEKPDLKDLLEAAEEMDEKEKVEVPADADAHITNRAFIRYAAGSAVWRAKQYEVRAAGRVRSEEYKEHLKENWETKKDEYNKQRREQRAKAIADLLARGYIVKTGRPAIPPGAVAIPKKAIEPVTLDELVVLGDPRVFEKVDYQIIVPDEFERVKSYLGVSVINVDVSPLKWGMWRFAAWDELRKATRYGYISNARNALGGDVGYLTDPANQEKRDHFLFYDPVLDKVFDDMEKDTVPEVGEEADEKAEELEPVEKKKGKGKKSVFSRNPIRVVKFMLSIADFNPWFVVQQTCDQSYTIANARASALASCCYAYLRNLYKSGLYKGEEFRKVLMWSQVFERYTRVAKRITGDKHASQQTTEEKLANTVAWDTWRTVALGFIGRYFVLKNNSVEIRTRATGYKPWWPGRPTEMRGRPTVLDNESKEVVIKPKQLLPWWKADYDVGQTGPTLRELRDATIVACYSLMAPIRLDWATVEIMSPAEFDKFKVDKQAAETKEVEEQAAADPNVPKKRKRKFNINIIVVERDATGEPIAAPMAYFGQMKNIASFKVTPVPKFIRRESPLCENIILAFLKERRRIGFDSMCLFPYSTFMGLELKPRDPEMKAMNCFNNSAFGERLADISWELTGLNFTETLMRRSYITWFWTTTDAAGKLVNDPLDTTVWDVLLPSVHQNSKDANLGYIKGVLAEYQQWLALNPKATAEERRDKRNDLSQKALELEGHNVARGQDPEVDKDDAADFVALRQQIKAAKDEEQLKVGELRRSKRLAAPLGLKPPSTIVPQPEPPAPTPTPAPAPTPAPTTKARRKKALPPPQAPPPPVTKAVVEQRRSGRVRNKYY
jgi:hypothetical protein